MENNNPFIENLRKTYQESIELIDKKTNELIENGSEMTAIMKFSEISEKIREVYETSKSLYSIIYMSTNILEHFNSKKVTMKLIPLISFNSDNIQLNSGNFEKYKTMLHDNFVNFRDEHGNFESDAFFEFFVLNLLDEAGYKKKHWYYKPSYINELEFMLDFLSSFIESDYNPIPNDAESDNKVDNDRYIPKEVKIAVWRRDLGKCSICGSKEKLEYDHIIPVSKGGSNTERNVQLLCEKCNRKKSDSIQ